MFTLSTKTKSYEGAKLVGLAEPFGKRTVEGDLGNEGNFQRCDERK